MVFALKTEPPFFSKTLKGQCPDSDILLVASFAKIKDILADYFWNIRKKRVRATIDNTTT